MRGVSFQAAVALHNHVFHFTARCVRLQPLHKRIRQEPYVGILDSLIDTYNLRVGLGAHQTGESVASVAAYAAAFVRVLFIKHDPDGHMKRFQARTCEVFGQLLNARLMANGGPGIRGVSGWLGGIFSTISVDLIEILRLRVVRLHIVIADRPSRGDSAMMTQFPEIFFAQSDQRSPVKLRITIWMIERGEFSNASAFETTIAEGTIFCIDHRASS